MNNRKKGSKLIKVNKRKVLVKSIIVCLLAILAAGTLAFFTDYDTAYNVISMGMIDIAVHETTIDEQGKEIPFPEECISNIVPGMKVVKKVWVENLGTESVYVRINVERKLTPSELDPKYIHLEGVNNEDWTLVGDYYYYNSAVEPDEVTTLLFDAVRFDKYMPNPYRKSKVEVIVKAEAVQVKNNGETVFDAVGWPSSK